VDAFTSRPFGGNPAAAVEMKAEQGFLPEHILQFIAKNLYWYYHRACRLRFIVPESEGDSETRLVSGHRCRAIFWYNVTAKDLEDHAGGLTITANLH
jgi:hypothetical protein